MTRPNTKSIAWLPLLLLLTLTALPVALYGVERFPPPEFDSGHELPQLEQTGIKSVWHSYGDVVLLAAALAIAAYLVHRRRSRRGLFLLSITCLIYFGFIRHGCVCSIGAIQNIAQACTDKNIIVSWAVIGFFFLPLVFALFFGRVFCAGVCPLGAMQELVQIKAVKLPRWLTRPLRILPMLYLAAAVLMAATGAGFIICRYDPFIAFFRLTGTASLLIFSGCFILLSMFIGRPYCRFMCPYAVLLRWCGLLTRYRVKTTPTECVQCRLCEDSCPYDALDKPIHPETIDNKTHQRRILAGAILLIPISTAFFALIGGRCAEHLATSHRTVATAEYVVKVTQLYQTGQRLPRRAYRRIIGRDHSALYRNALAIKEDYQIGGYVLGGIIGAYLAGQLLGLSVFRRNDDYEPNQAECLACTRCYTTCPQQRQLHHEPEGITPDGFSLKKIQPKAVPYLLAAIGLAVAGLLTWVAITMWHEAQQNTVHDFLRDRTVAKLRADLKEFPDDEIIRDSLRQADKENRTELFGNLRQLHQGRYIMLILAVIGLAIIKMIHAARPGSAKIPPTNKGTNLAAAGIHDRINTRRAHLVMMVLLAGGALLWLYYQPEGLTADQVAALSPTTPTETTPSSTNQSTTRRLRQNTRQRARTQTQQSQQANQSSATVTTTDTTTDAAADTAKQSTTSADPQPQPYQIPAPDLAAKQWAGFRGTDGQGRYEHGTIVTQWNETTHVVWKTQAPLSGHSSPIVWGRRLLITAANQQQRIVACYDTKTGKELWRQAVATDYHDTPAVWDDTGYAASTPVTDGQYVYAIFATGHLACISMQGELQWQHYFGPWENAYGYANSLVRHNDMLYVQIDQGYADDELSKLYALKLPTGEMAWQVTRPVGGSWATPLIINAAGKTQLVTLSDPWAIAYQPDTGKEIWRSYCMGSDAAPSPSYAANLVIAIQPNAQITAIDPTGTGDVTDTHTRWTGYDGVPDITSPVTNDKRLWTLTTDGQLCCYELTGQGEALYCHYLEQQFNSSPTIVGDKLYLIAIEGDMYVISATADEFTLIEQNHLDDRFFASPAFHNNIMYLRGEQHLYAIGKEADHD